MFETLQVTKSSHVVTITIHRPEHRNSINTQLIKEIQQVLDEADLDQVCRFIVLQGENNLFCTGMDFEELTQQIYSSQLAFTSNYMQLLKRFTNTSKVIISLLDGQVLAGGVGIAAASDLVISTSQTQFSLSEALWGLLPACVTPFLIRRIGFQKAYSMTLTTETLTAAKAYSLGLIDELTDNPTESLRRILLRLIRIEENTIKDLKAYFRKMWIINEEMEETAIAEIDRLINKPQVRSNIKNFIEHHRLPWEKESIANNM